MPSAWRSAITTARPRADAAARYFARLLGLADWCRFLVVCCPGGPATHNLVDAQVLGALGPDGWLVNVARGSVVDEAALVAALEGGAHGGRRARRLRDRSPQPHPALLARNDVILLPHIGSATVETRDAMARAMVERAASARSRPGSGQAVSPTGMRWMT